MFAILVNSIPDKRVEVERYDLRKWSIFARRTIKEYIRFAGTELSTRVTGYQNFQYQPENTVITMCVYCYSNSKKCISIFTEKNYMPRVAMNALRDVSDAIYDFKDLDEECGKILEIYNNQKEIDIIERLTMDTYNAKQVLIEDVNKLLERGENIEKLVEKAEEISFVGKAFMKKSKDLNRCCTVI